MKKLLLFSLAATSCFGQFTTTARHIRWGTSTPATCSVTTGDVFFKTSATIAVYYCSAANTWTALGVAGAGTAFSAITAGTNAAALVMGTGGSLATSGSGTITANALTTPFGLVYTALSTPSAPSLATVGTPGAATYGYKITATTLVGSTVASSEATIATGNATLGGTNKIRLTWSAVTGATGYTVWRTTGSGGNGLLATLGVVLTYDDVGTAVDPDDWYSDSPFNLNTTRGLASAYNLYVAGHSAFGNNSYVDYDPSMKYQGNDQNTVLGLAETVTDATRTAYLIFGSQKLSVPTGGWGIETTLYTDPYSASDFSAQSLYGAQFNAYHAAASALSALTGSNVQVNNYGGTLTDAIGYLSHFRANGTTNVRGYTANIDSGTPTTYKAYEALSAGTTTYHYYSNLTAAANQWAFYGAGTAASHFGGAIDITGSVMPTSYATATNCADSAGAAACGSAAAGAFVVDAAATSTVVSTTAVTANSEIIVFFDSGLGTRLGVTCNATVPTVYGVTARTAGASFTLSATAPVANPACFNYLVIN